MKLPPDFHQLLIGGALIVALAAGVINGCVTKAHAQGTAPQEQASNLAVPEVTTKPVPRSIVLIATCGRLVGVFVVDSYGDVHPVDLARVSKQQLQLDILKLVPADKVLQATVPCVSGESALPL